jgi:hypothetical protein
MHKLLLALPVLFLFLASCAPSNVSSLVNDKGAEKLSPEQVLTLVEGNTLRLTGYDTDAYLYLDKSGRTFAVDNYGEKDLGQWDVSDLGEFCNRMQNWWYADLICYQVYQVGDSYKLTDSNGLIKFTALQYPGDYKGIYYDVRRGKKSFRKSIRSGGAAAAPGVTSEPKSEPESTAPEPSAEKAISEENTYKISQEDKNLRSTVKWMARDCPGCNLAETNLKKADLVGAKLAGANLSGSNLRMANLRRADLEGANLEDAVLAYANLPGANLKNANLRGANLKGANLIRADLTGADLSGADLDGALLEGVRGLKR